MERYIWTAHPFVAYTMVDKLFNPLTLLVGPCFVAYLIYKSFLPTDHGGYHLPWWNIILSYMVWLTATRTAKLLPHLWYRPQDVVYVPAFILFGYYFAVMKLYALCTLHETGLGTRAGIGDISAATAAADKLNEEKLGTNMNTVSSHQGMSHTDGNELMSPFRDQSPYRDMPSANYAPPPPPKDMSMGGRNMRRRGADEEVGGLQMHMTPMNFGYAQ